MLGVLSKNGIAENSITKFQTGGPGMCLIEGFLTGMQTGDLGSNEIKISMDKTIGIVDGSGVLYGWLGDGLY